MLKAENHLFLLLLVFSPISLMFLKLHRVCFFKNLFSSCYYAFWTQKTDLKFDFFFPCVHLNHSLLVQLHFLPDPKDVKRVSFPRNRNSQFFSLCKDFVLNLEILIFYFLKFYCYSRFCSIMLVSSI